MSETAEELDLHGLTVAEAIPLVDRFPYDAYREKRRRVWIIHGRGTGTLRRAVRQYLAAHALVRTCTTADGSRGGVGATQVEIAD
jgi:DNA mismatch repair protein MutS2